jgi:predicted deacylase
MAASPLMTLENQGIQSLAHRDIRAVAEALADVLVERGLVTPASPARVLDAAQVADLLGRDRQWVYAHAGELGAFRYGDGPKARIGFDLVTVEQWKRERQIRSESPPRRRDRRRSSGVGVGATRLIPYDVPGSGT